MIPEQMTTILFATHYKPLVSLLERAMQGKANVCQVDPNPDTVLKSLGTNEPAVVALHATKGDDEWLSLVKTLHASRPGLKTVAFGEATDVASVARGIVHGLAGYVPLNLGTNLFELSTAVTTAVTGADATADSVFGRIKGMLPALLDDSVFSVAGRKISHEEAIRRCDSLGLKAEDIAKHLQINEDQARIVRARGATNLLEGIAFRTVLKYALALGVLVLCIQISPAILRWRSITTVPVSGVVSYRGEPIETGAVMFVPQGDTKGGSAGGPIEKGRYSLPAVKGLERGGKYRVEITGLKRKGEQRVSPMGQGVSHEQFIPSEFNRESGLMVEVPQSANQLLADYDL